uniref:Uncharacterized protein n=1 Tax=Lepeophtheirus salmonis TaxID=72036 RepID=A0A0K2VHG5_LEPSM
MTKDQWPPASLILVR